MTDKDWSYARRLIRTARDVENPAWDGVDDLYCLASDLADALEKEIAIAQDLMEALRPFARLVDAFDRAHILGSMSVEYDQNLIVAEPAVTVRDYRKARAAVAKAEDAK